MSWYAIHKGRKTGICKYWISCKKYVTDYPGAVYKKFLTKEEALYFVEHGKPNNKQHNTDKNITDRIDIYTDGSCIMEDRGRIRYAGYGVYIPMLGVIESHILTGEKTNNRAELMAIVRTLKIVDQPARIHTDSMYVINTIKN